jgi:hypothetical protein
MNFVLRSTAFVAVKAFVLVAALTLWTPFQVYAAATLYSHDFEAAPIGQFCCPQGGLFWSQGNIGGTDLIWDHTANGGTDGSKGLNVLFDGTDRPSYFVGLYDFEPIASDANPLGNGAVSSPSHVRFSIDVKTTGNINSKPIRLTVSQTDPNYQADRGIDANMDGDMTDSALIFSSILRPTLLVAGDYNHLTYTLDQGELSASITRNPPFGLPVVIPLTPEFDPTVSLFWAMYFFDDGFGSDAGNIVSIDNIRIEAVPEPSSIFLLGMGAISLLGYGLSPRVMRVEISSITGIRSATELMM